MCKDELQEERDERWIFRDEKKAILEKMKEKY